MSSVASSAQCRSSSTTTVGRAQRRQQRDQRLARARAALQHGRQLAAGVRGHVVQRAERARRVERLARAREHADAVESCRELAHERRLADARFTGDQHDATVAGGRDGLELLGQRGQLDGAFQKRVRARFGGCRGDRRRLCQPGGDRAEQEVVDAERSTPSQESPQIADKGAHTSPYGWKGSGHERQGRPCLPSNHPHLAPVLAAVLPPGLRSAPWGLLPAPSGRPASRPSRARRAPSSSPPR